MPLFPIPDLIDLVEDEPLRDKFKALALEFAPKMKELPASTRFHHWWKGGLLEHVVEVMNYSAMIIQGMSTLQEGLPGLDKALILAFVHDLDKVGRYVPNTRRWPKGPFRADEDRPICESSGLIFRMVQPFGIDLDEDMLHAITFHHGGWAEYFKTYPYARMSPTATVLHTADLLSGNIRGMRNGYPEE